MSLIAVHGNNFSGRTVLLHNLARATSTDAPGVYIGPEIYNYISALSATVEAELELHRPSARSSTSEAERTLADELNLAGLFDRNPFTLSGGQQAAVALASASLMEREVVAADSCLEQLDTASRRIFLRWAESQETRWFVADNRLDEFATEITWAERRAATSDLANEQAGPLHPMVPRQDWMSSDHLSATLDLEDVNFEYHSRHPVLRGLSMSLSPGLYTLEGANGAGKSTLAKLLCGVLRPTKGSIRNGGQDAKTWRSPGRLVAYHFQNPDLQLFSSTVSDELQGSGRFPSREALANFATSFGLHDALDHHPLDLPFVGRKRVALAATMAMPAPWLVLDEPTLGQDTSTMATIAKLIEGFISAGRGVIIISHSISFKRSLGGSTIVMEGGRARVSRP